MEELIKFLIHSTERVISGEASPWLIVSVIGFIIWAWWALSNKDEIKENTTLKVIAISTGLPLFILVSYFLLQTTPQ